MEHLFDREHQIVKLFAPPFDEGERDPGYIRGYLPGVRENGGQYTHAAVWLALALFRLGRGDEGHEVLHALLPAAHAPECYQAEPYVLAADVYANPQHPGRGGWSWYTGAAGWFYRTAVEELLGLRVREGGCIWSPVCHRRGAAMRREWALTSGRGSPENREDRDPRSAAGRQALRGWNTFEPAPGRASGPFFVLRVSKRKNIV